MSAGRPPYGWAHVDGELTPVYDQQQTIRTIIQLHDQGHALRSIAEYLNGEGVRRPTGGLWRSESVRRVLGKAGRVPGRVRAGRGQSDVAS